MTKLRYQAILNFLTNCLIWSYLGVTLSTGNVLDNFCFTSVPLFPQNSKFSVLMLIDLIKCKYRLRKTKTSYICIFSVCLDLLFVNVLKEMFALGT